MAKIEGDQEIPSALLDLYRGTITEKQPDGTSRKRYPYRLPQMQADGADVKPGQLKQRNRFLQVRNRFHTLSASEKARWYAARPPWSSFLWYFNYFMMSGLMDVLGATPEGASVIKSIKHYPFTMAAGAPADITVAISDIDPTKAMGFLYGSGYMETSREDPVVWWAWNVYPLVLGIYTTAAVVRAASAITIAAGCSISIVEYI